MPVLITAVIFGLVFALFSTQNSVGVPINLGPYLFNGIPLYLLILTSLLVGMVLAWIISLFDSLGAFFSLRRKDSKLREEETKIRELQSKVYHLEVENARLNRPNTPLVEDAAKETSVETPKENVFAKIRRNLITHQENHQYQTSL